MKKGKVTENVYRRSVLRQLKMRREEVVVGAGLGEDCAIFSPGKLVKGGESTSNVVVTCVLEGTDSVGYLVSDSVGRLACKGAQAVAITLQVLLPPDSEETKLKALIAEAENRCVEFKIQIAQVSARVTEAVNCPVVTVVSYGVAQKASGYHTTEATEPGQDIVVSKWIGLRGTAVLAREYRESLLQRYPKWICDNGNGFEQYLSVMQEAAVAIKSGVCTILQVAEGGILAALWELAEGAGVGLTIELKKLPIRQETVEICNYLNVNPYELWSGGCLLMTARDGQKLVDALEAEGIPAVLVGRTTDCNDRLIRNEEEVRYLDRPGEDSLYEKVKENRL